ncbi:hypothetical protein FO519_005232 [Halicephalobus sp. NKZ332]|nr:hypothetical protein FO519_005232 [Halicephalobus sp. NKZ332]
MSYVNSPESRDPGEFEEGTPSTLAPSLYYQVKSVQELPQRIDFYKLFSLTSVISMAAFLLIFYALRVCYVEWRKRRRCKITDNHERLINSFTEQSEITLFNSDSVEENLASYGSIL